MIRWTMLVRNEQFEDVVDLMTSPSPFHLRETCQIQFNVWLEEEHYQTIGAPYVVLGDIPIPLTFSHYDDNGRVFISEASIESHASRYFYNFFGDSELALCFESEGVTHTAVLNILARRDNASLAKELLNFITEHLEDAVSICFSRSKLSTGIDRERNMKFSRLDLIDQTVQHLSRNLPSFVREHNFGWRTEMQISMQGQPCGPESVHWVLTNLDRVTPASADEANLIYHNRSYRLDELPSEHLKKDSDVFENQVVMTFLHHAIEFLFDIREQFKNYTEQLAPHVDQEYIRFDATMRQYTELALKHKVAQVDTLLLAVEQLKRTFSKHLPSRIVPGIQPRITPYVVRHVHYRKAFELIELCYKATAPNFQGANLLLGLKNLALVYETASLLMVHQTIEQVFGVVLKNQCYKVQAEHLPFGGEVEERPDGVTNNYFTYSGDEYDIKLLYEPKIYPFSIHSQPGDLVDTSIARRTKYGAHHFCPDFVISIESKKWKKPVTIILDSKYKDASTIRRFDIDELTRKYLLNIHQVNQNRRLGVSPVNLLILMFPHERSGKQISNVAAIHRLDGEYPVLPQSAAVLVKPSNKELLHNYFTSLINVFDEELYI